MTANELHAYFNRVFGMNEQWPKTFEVDADTYGNCCQAIFNSFALVHDVGHNCDLYSIALGPSRGLMFKNVELILKP